MNERSAPSDPGTLPSTANPLVPASAARRHAPSVRRFAGIRCGLAVAATIASFLSPLASHAAIGDLTADSCVQNTGGIACGATAPGISGVAAVEVSSDGMNVYAASLDNSAVALFGRSPMGALTSAGCIQNSGGTDCNGVGGTAAGLAGATDVATSPDGMNVYVVSNESDTIVTFARGLDGMLTATSCIADTGEPALCADTGGTTPGLLSPAAVAISPDGLNVYVVSFLNDSIVTFTRAVDGTLTPAGCIQNTGGSVCTGTGGTTPGLDGAYDVTVSPDGTSVYVTAYTSNTVVTFSRGPGGELTPEGCIQNTGGVTCSGIGGNAPGLSGPRSVVVSPDGTSVYVAGFLSDAVATFHRAGDGTLTAAGCIQNTGGSVCTAPEDTTPGLDGPSALVISPDGMNVYAATTFSDAVVAFARDDMNGALTPLECVQNTGRTECVNAGGSTTPGLDGAFDIAMSPGGTHVYVASYNGDAIAVFSREGFPATSTTTTTTNTTTTSTTTTTLPPTTTTTLTPETTTTTLAPETTTTTTLAPETTTTTTLTPETTTTTLAPETTTTTSPPDTTTTTSAPETTTTLAPETTTTTLGPETTTTTLAPETTTTTTTPETTTTTLTPETTTTTTPDDTTTTTTAPPGICGDWNDSGNVSVTDSLAILKASVGGNECDAQPCICDVAGGGTILATDALAALRIAVGLDVVTQCNC